MKRKKSIENITKVASLQRIKMYQENGYERIFTFTPLIRKFNGDISLDKDFYKRTKKRLKQDRSNPIFTDETISIPIRTARCENCDEKLAMFKSEKEVLDNDARCINLCSSHDDQHWYGVYGANVNPETGEVNIECCCGNRVIKHKGEVTGNNSGKEVKLENYKRYTKFYIE